jgi:cytochrome b6-f complex iron-sulfur subunit
MLNRREFLQSAGLTAGTIALLPVSRAMAKKLAIPLNKADKLKTVDGSAVLMVKDNLILFVRDSVTSIKALSPVCTHQKCTVAYNPNQKRIECACHGSSFDLNGKVLKGPATTPLRTYAAVLDGDRIVVTVD